MSFLFKIWFTGGQKAMWERLNTSHAYAEAAQLHHPRHDGYIWLSVFVMPVPCMWTGLFQQSLSQKKYPKEERDRSWVHVIHQGTVEGTKRETMEGRGKESLYGYRLAASANSRPKKRIEYTYIEYDWSNGMIPGSHTFVIMRNNLVTNRSKVPAQDLDCFDSLSSALGMAYPSIP